MFRLSAKVEISGDAGSWTFEKITSCEIERDADALTATCKLTLPRKVKWEGQTSNPIRRGDKIKVWLGYDDDLELAFVGYVETVSILTPCVITCFDQMSKLFDLPVDYSLFSAGIKMIDFLKSVFDGKVIAPDFSLSAWDRSSAVYVSQWFLHYKRFGYDKFFFRIVDDEPQLCCLNSFAKGVKDNVRKFKFDSSVNVFDWSRIKDFQPGSDQVYVRITAFNPQDGNKRCFVERGDFESASMRFIFRNPYLYKDKAENIADYIVLKHSSVAASGSFSAFGAGLPWPFDIVTLTILDNELGSFYVRKNHISFSKNGFHQNITLGYPVRD